MIAQFIIALMVVALASAKVFYEEKNMQLYQWGQFKATWNKAYPERAEEDRRFNIFLSNLKLIDERNALESQANGTAIHGINQFSDLSREEFAKRFLNLDISKATQSNAVKVEGLKASADSTSVDWSGVFTTPVKDQGYCGSCWAFSATEQLESDSMRVLGTSFLLAPQQIVSCDPVSYGCQGGWPTWAFDYLKSSNGQEQESAYPYTSGTTGDSGVCAAKASDNVIGVSAYYQITGASTADIESSMKAHVLKTGPLSICADASSWSTYRGGVMTVCGQSINHAIQAVGVNTDEGYWKVRNSWGTSWGESGYIRLALGKNTCGITFMPLYTDPVKV
jgi:C1A family cysteine protease